MVISIESLSDKFSDHLDMEANFRIIFSGKFGMGKTFFLNKYFDERSNAFNKILISPVNYVISSNEDIFELIKADILKELFLNGKINLEKLPKDTLLQKISKYFEDNPLALPRFMAKSLAKINPITETPIAIIEAIGKLIEDYRSKSRIKSAVDKTCEEEVAEYLDESELKIGSIYEYNYITKVINGFLKEIKGDKRNVLIIDDLDRIDPEHIFRILNVFSAHNNHFGEENKFLFDHIILVCDIHNIKKIFEHRFGEGVDFEGYIDKFYSTDIFLVSNEDALKFYIESGLATGVDDLGFTTFLQFILTSLVDAGELSVRKMIKHKHSFTGKSFVLIKQEGLTPTNMEIRQGRSWMRNYRNLFIDSNDLPILVFFKLMTIIYGEFNEFYIRFRKLIIAASKTQRSYDVDEVNVLLQFLALQKHIATNSDDELFFKLTYGSNFRDEFVLTEIGLPQVSIASITYNIDLQWNQNNIYIGQSSYFQNSKVVNADMHQYLSDKSQTSVSAHEIFKAVDEIITGCYEKGYLKRAGIVFKIV